MINTKAFGYCRVSSKGQVTRDGFPRQIAAISTYAKQNKIEVFMSEHVRKMTLKAFLENEVPTTKVVLADKLYENRAGYDLIYIRVISLGKVPQRFSCSAGR